MLSEGRELRLPRILPLSDEKVPVRHRHNTEICKFEHGVHYPHDMIADVAFHLCSMMPNIYICIYKSGQNNYRFCSEQKTYFHAKNLDKLP